MSGERPRDAHWLARPRTIRLLWWLFLAVLALSVGLQFVVPVKAHFRVDGWFGFGAVFGFLSCLAMVLVARMLGWLLKRRDDYYHVQGDPGVDVPFAVENAGAVGGPRPAASAGGARSAHDAAGSPDVVDTRGREHSRGGEGGDA